MTDGPVDFTARLELVSFLGNRAVQARVREVCGEALFELESAEGAIVLDLEEIKKLRDWIGAWIPEAEAMNRAAEGL